MKLKNLSVCLVMAGLTAVSHGASSFTEDFSDNSASPNMVLGTGFGSPVTNTTGAFTITSGDGARIYLGTNDSDYSLFDFTFEADVSVPATTSSWAIAFFGMGNASTAAGISEPTNGPGISMLLRNDNDNLENLDNGFVSTSKVNSGIVAATFRTHGVRMEWNATTQLATFLFDLGNDGTYDAPLTFSVDGSNNGFTGTNSQLFLGGGNGLSFDNISVVSAVPEPSAALLGGLGVLGLLRRRRN